MSKCHFFSCSCMVYVPKSNDFFCRNCGHHGSFHQIPLLSIDHATPFYHPFCYSVSSILPLINHTHFCPSNDLIHHAHAQSDVHSIDGELLSRRISNNNQRIPSPFNQNNHTPSPAVTASISSTLQLLKSNNIRRIPSPSFPSTSRILPPIISNNHENFPLFENNYLPQTLNSPLHDEESLNSQSNPFIQFDFNDNDNYSLNSSTMSMLLNQAVPSEADVYPNNYPPQALNNPLNDEELLNLQNIPSNQSDLNDNYSNQTYQVVPSEADIYPNNYPLNNEELINLQNNPSNQLDYSMLLNQTYPVPSGPDVDSNNYFPPQTHPPYSTNARSSNSRNNKTRRKGGRKNKHDPYSKKEPTFNLIYLNSSAKIIPRGDNRKLTLQDIKFEVDSGDGIKRVVKEKYTSLGKNDDSNDGTKRVVIKEKFPPLGENWRFLRCEFSDRKLRLVIADIPKNGWRVADLKKIMSHKNLYIEIF